MKNQKECDKITQKNTESKILDSKNQKKCNEIIQRNIQYKMLELGLNSRTLAKKANVGKSLVYDFFIGKSKNPSIKNIRRIANALNVSVSWMIGEESEASSDKLGLVEITNQRYKKSSTGIFMHKENIIYHHTMVCIISQSSDEMEPLIKKDELILADVSEKVISDSGIYALRFKSNDKLKVYRVTLNPLKGNSFTLTPDNSKYTPFEIQSEDIEVVGKVVKVIRNI